jgi:3-hydroxyisobutyrate dehydrogenase-like beta-hydroxyacid dehydrogenase
VKLVNNALFAAHIGLLAESIRLGERLGVPESTLLAALAHGSASSRVLSLVATGGSVASFIEVTGEFVGKDVALVRGIAEGTRQGSRCVGRRHRGHRRRREGLTWQRFGLSGSP